MKEITLDDLSYPICGGCWLELNQPDFIKSGCEWSDGLLQFRAEAKICDHCYICNDPTVLGIYLVNPLKSKEL